MLPDNLIVQQDLVVNFRLLANRMEKSAKHFRISKNSRGEEILKVNGILRRILLWPYYSRTAHEESLVKFINAKVATIEQLEQSSFLNEKGEYNSLFESLQKYNQSLKRHQELGLNLSFVGKLEILKREDIKDLNPATIILDKPVENHHAELAKDKPEIYQERRFSFRHGFKKSKVSLYPTDKTADGKPISHSAEAKKIFFSTQIERLVSLIGRICEFIGRIFGCTVTRFEKYHYNKYHETADQIYSVDRPLSPTVQQVNSPPPTSYWVGHATLMLSVPLKAKGEDDDQKAEYASFNVITDPVEGDLNSLLYPRQTKFAVPMEELPAPHVYLLSHNHLDHYSEPTIKKLIAQQPVMIVPVGDGQRYTKQGFVNVHEMNWWDEQTISFKKEEKVYEMNVVATPARHWAGQGPCGGHESSFLGFIIQGHEGGDIYFAGDTARLGNDEKTIDHVRMLREYYPSIRWNFQPGGPDEVRKDMETTHQASVDALWMHAEMMLRRIYETDEPITLDEFMSEAREVKTIFMHTMAFKLGNLHLSDTKDSVKKVLDALYKHAAMTNDFDEMVSEEIDRLKKQLQVEKKKKQIDQLNEKIEQMEQGKGPYFEKMVEVRFDLKGYEWQVYQELSHFCEEAMFAGDDKFSQEALADLLRETVIVPKIGSRLDLEASKQDQKEKIYDTFLL